MKKVLFLALGLLLVAHNPVWVLVSEVSASPDGRNHHEFAFARLVYDGSGEGDWPRWQADWPEAEFHFSAGLSRLTRIDVAPEGTLVDFSSPSIFDYPWIYAVEVGALNLTNPQAARLREYLLRGGFLLVDDFHGSGQWRQFEKMMLKVFPDRQIIDLTEEQGVFHVLFDVGELMQIPGIRPLMMNRTFEYDGVTPHWRAILNDEGEPMVVINFNMDLGDAWEHADDARYPAKYTASAYRLGVNYVVYAMTH
ncbi:MAG: DUF4159 domain-containing protein [Gammaproteobacteria bacterium]|nr:DUF4159 domain-containing protein [Gammaproteobacteria bacterium]